MKQIVFPEEYFGTTGISLYAGGDNACDDDWRYELSHRLSNSSLIICNEVSDDVSLPDFQIIWRYNHMVTCDAISFWFAESEFINLSNLIEFGKWLGLPKKLFVGCDPNYGFKKEIETRCKLDRPNLVVVDSIEQLSDQILEWSKKKEKDFFARDKDQPKAVGE